jgi:hypothetical protein
VNLTHDNGYIITGSAYDDLYYLKLDSNGNIVWEDTYGGVEPDIGYCVHQTKDGGYIIAGVTYSFGAGFCDIWLVKLETQNNHPIKPILDGPLVGRPGRVYNFTVNSIDPDEDEIRYHLNWGDAESEVTDWYPSGDPLIVSHTWIDEGKYTITAYAEDRFGAISETATLIVNMPRTKAINTPFLNFLQSHPNMFPIIQRLFQRFGLQ